MHGWTSISTFSASKQGFNTHSVIFWQEEGLISGYLASWSVYDLKVGVKKRDRVYLPCKYAGWWERVFWEIQTQAAVPLSLLHTLQPRSRAIYEPQKMKKHEHIIYLIACDWVNLQCGFIILRHSYVFNKLYLHNFKGNDQVWDFNIRVGFLYIPWFLL